MFTPDSPVEQTPLVGSTTFAEVSIRELKPGEDATAFRTLNEEWITRLFALEPKDKEILGDPESLILKKGGYVYIASWEGTDIGCVALLHFGEGVFELSKMAVAPSTRGRGVGRRLVEHAIDEARRLGARSLFLGSSSKLKDAVHIYETVGFEHVPVMDLPPLPYTRADIFMELVLEP